MTPERFAEIRWYLSRYTMTSPPDVPNPHTIISDLLKYCDTLKAERDAAVTSARNNGDAYAIERERAIETEAERDSAVARAEAMRGALTVARQQLVIIDDAGEWNSDETIAQIDAALALPAAAPTSAPPAQQGS